MASRSRNFQQLGGCDLHNEIHGGLHGSDQVVSEFDVGRFG